MTSKSLNDHKDTTYLQGLTEKVTDGHKTTLNITKGNQNNYIETQNNLRDTDGLQ